MKIKLIADRFPAFSAFTVGKVYEVFDKSETKYFFYDDDEDLRYIAKDLKGAYLDREIVEE